MVDVPFDSLRKEENLGLRPVGPLLRAHISKTDFIAIELFVYHGIQKCDRKLANQLFT